MSASLRPYAPPMLRIAQWLLPLGSDQGAMLVEASGGGRRASWRLNADANRGPYVPVLAALAMVRRWRDGRAPVAGAAVCSGMLQLGEFEDDFTALGMTTCIDRADR